MTAPAKFFDPLRLFGLFNLLGDALLIGSGVSFVNYVRMSGAVLGIVASLIGLCGINFSVGGWPTRKIVMALVAVCGFIYILSGSNVFGFESVPRYGEMVLGALLMLGCILNLAGRPLLGSVSMVTGNLFFAAAAWEPLLSGRHFDVGMFGSFLCFTTANILSRWIKPGNAATLIAAE